MKIAGTIDCYILCHLPLSPGLEDIIVARTYRRGSKGDEVSLVQRQLQALGVYGGAIDGDFGGETEIAVRRFQRDRGLDADGIVGSGTWRALFPQTDDVPAPALLNAPLELRCLALTGAFETNVPPPGCFSCISGDFDGQGLSYGALQFNLGQGTLQTLLLGIDQRHPDVMEDIFDRQVHALRGMLSSGDLASQLAFARSIQTPNFRVHEPWRGMFVALGRTPACQEAQLEEATQSVRRARRLCERFGVTSPRALALMFDIIVQNGSISTTVAAQIDEDIRRIDRTLDAAAQERERLCIVANRRAEAAHPRWVEDVRTRKLCIANGHGQVHGAFYDLEEQYGLALDQAALA
jgi:hypothetical protein